MSKLKLISSLRSDCRGVTALEYGLIAGVLVIAIIAGFTTLGGAMENQFENVSTSLNAE